MKKFLAVFLIILLLCGCSVKEPDLKENNNDAMLYGMWVTYSELNGIADNFDYGFEQLCIKAKDMGITALFVHVRAFCDSIYPSGIFPKNQLAQQYTGDALSTMINLCKKYSLEFHGWINPYRVALSGDIASLDPLSPVISNPSLLGQTQNGLYLNPASAHARRLVIDGVREIITAYDIDGIHFDDYFYPTTDESFDIKEYTQYASSAVNPLSLDDWRRINVNMLISGVYSAIKSSGKDVCFSVSPSADIEKNYGILYADVQSWCKAGYIDAVIPQLYFGFDYPIEKFTFEQLTIDWIKLTQNTDTTLYIGLAPYKLDTDNSLDNAEWENGTDIVARQLLHIKNQADIKGAVFFSSSYLFKEEENFKKQNENIKNIIKEK
ncbi:MAG: family 10 glycosylhydrolase [Acutalibacteraceae bacterium]|nr:family 10 glycosylhydrolase [Acutalibacteraceae bacterium]